MMSKLCTLEFEGKLIQRIQKLTNVILANSCYSEKEMENQIQKAQNLGNLNSKELKLIKSSWALRKKKANNCLMN